MKCAKKEKVLSEFQECVLFNNWIETMPMVKPFFHHSPNELCKEKHDAINMKKIGMSPGFPDYCIFIPGNHYKALFIEMKRSDRRNQEMNEEQVAWIIRLEEQGYMAKFAFGFEDAKRIVINYLDDTDLKSLVRPL
jgi:hypothetical protein